MTDTTKPRFAEIVVVEGLHDKQAVLRAVDADVWVLGGDRVAHKTMQELTRAAHTRGVIVFTDPDGPGERIRRRLAQALPGCKHAFLAQSAALGQGKIGVEHASSESIRLALDKATRQSITSAPAMPAHGYTIADLQSVGLVASAESAALRRRVGEALGIGYANAKSFVWKLNALGITREEWLAALKQCGLDSSLR